MIEKLVGTQVGWDLQSDEIPNKINEIIGYLNGHHHDFYSPLDDGGFEMCTTTPPTGLEEHQDNE